MGVPIFPLTIRLRPRIESREGSAISCPGAGGLNMLRHPLTSLETAWQPEREKYKVRLVTDLDFFDQNHAYFWTL